EAGEGLGWDREPGSGSIRRLEGAEPVCRALFRGRPFSKQSVCQVRGGVAAEDGWLVRKRSGGRHLRRNWSGRKEREPEVFGGAGVRIRARCSGFEPAGNAPGSQGSGSGSRSSGEGGARTRSVAFLPDSATIAHA